MDKRVVFRPEKHLVLPEVINPAVPQPGDKRFFPHELQKREGGGHIVAKPVCGSIMYELAARIFEQRIDKGETGLGRRRPHQRSSNSVRDDLAGHLSPGGPPHAVTDDKDPVLRLGPPWQRPEIVLLVLFGTNL